MKNLSQYLSISKIRELHEKYEAHLSAAAVIFGFTVDSLTLQRIDLVMENVIIIAYLVLAGAAIVVMNLYNEGKLEWKMFEEAGWWVPLVMQFAFGGIFSVFLLFYGRSGSLGASWPFFAILLGLLVGNEFFRTRYQRMKFHVSVWYTAVFAYSILAIPMIVNEISAWVFIVSGLVSLGIVAAFVSLLSFSSPARVEKERVQLTKIIGGIFIMANVLYFLNIMPPIPLSLQSSAVAHSVTRSDGSYRLVLESEPWYERVIPGETIHIRSGADVYFYSAIFAPTDINTDIVHEWQHFNPDKNRWVITSRIRFPIRGGRDEGYRGYSIKNSPVPGRWRVSVETASGQIIGRDRFKIKYETEASDTRVDIR